MNFSLNKDDSLLVLNKQELKVKQPKRKKSISQDSYISDNILNEFTPKKKIKKSISLNNNNPNIKNFTKKKGITRHISSKDFPLKQIKLKRISYSNKSLNYFSLKTKKISKKKNNLNFIREEKPNLKQIENEIFAKIKKMKFNFQSDDDIFPLNTINSVNTFNNNSNRFNTPKNKNNEQNVRNSTFKKNMDNRSSIHSNNIRNSLNLNNSVLSNNNINNNINNTPKNIYKKNSFKYNSFIIKQDNLEQFQEDINEEFLNLTDYNNYNNKKLSIIKKINRIRNLKRAKPLYDSFDDDETEKDDEFSEKIISPESKFIIVFDLFLLLSCIYSLFYIPLRMARSECFCIQENRLNISLLYIIDFLYICDLFISFFRGYYNFQLKLIKNNIRIFIHYLKTDFIFDLLESIPIFTYSKFLCSYDKNINICLRLNMSNSLIFLKIISNLKIIKIFKVKNKKKNTIFYYFFELFSENYSLEKTVDSAFNILFCLLAFHFFVCVNIFLSKQTYPNWINNIQIQDMSLFNIYIASSYSLIETLTTVGYGDAVSQCNAERVFQIIILAVGVIAYSYLISAFGNLFKNESQASINYNNNMKILEEIRVEYPKMNFKLYKKIYNHIESRNMTEKKLDSNFLTNSLPFNLKNAVLLKIYDYIIKHFKFFKNCDNTNFIIEILSNLVPTTRKKNEFVLFEGEMIEEIVLIKDGRLSLEAAIDIVDQESSINKYFNINFQGITSKKEKEKKRLEEKYSSNLIDAFQMRDFDHVKYELNNALKNQVNCILNEVCEEPSFLNKTKCEKGNNTKDNNNCDNELKNEPIKNEEGNYKYIKVLDIRKNEYFGGVCILLRRPSPLSLKVKSKFTELYLLPKKEVFSISKNYNNIWNKIYKKEYHNMISIKHHTFKILDKYVEMNGISKINTNDITKNYGWDDPIKFRSSTNNLSIFNAKNNSFFPNKNINNIPESKFSINKNQLIQNNKGIETKKILDNKKNSQKSIQNKISISKNINFVNKDTYENSKNSKSEKYLINNNISINNDNNNMNNINNKNNIVESKSSDNSIFSFCKKNQKSKYKVKNNNCDLKDEVNHNINEENKANLLLKKESKNNEAKESKTNINKIKEKEEKEKNKNKENRKKIYSFGKKVAKLFKNKNIKIVFCQNNEEDNKELNEKRISSKTLNKDSGSINNYINIYQNNLFFDKIPEINSNDENSLNKFDKKELIKEDIISFSLKSIYKNINIHTNMKYSQNNDLQEKTLSYLNKLIENENKDFSSIIDLSSISRPKIENININDSNIKKESLSLSKYSNSSFKEYEEILNLKKLNFLNNNIEKNGLKLASIKNNNKNYNKTKFKTKKEKSKKNENNNDLNFSAFIKNELNGEIKDKEIFSPIRNLSPRKKKNRNSLIYNSGKILLEDNSLKNNSIRKKKKRKNSFVKIKRRKSRQLPIRKRNTLFEKYGFDLDTKNDNINGNKLNINEKKSGKRSSLKKQNTLKYLMLKNKNIDGNSKNEGKIDKNIENEGIKSSEDYFAKEEKDECKII